MLRAFFTWYQTKDLQQNFLNLPFTIFKVKHFELERLVLIWGHPKLNFRSGEPWEARKGRNCLNSIFIRKNFNSLIVILMKMAQIWISLRQIFWWFSTWGMSLCCTWGISKIFFNENLPSKRFKKVFSNHIRYKDWLTTNCCWA